MSYLADISAVAGVAVLAYGAWLIYPPAAFLVVGAILLTFGVAGVLGRRERGGE